MDSASVAPHGVPSSTRDGWRSIEHRVLKRRASVGRGPRRRRQRFSSPVRDAFETWRQRPLQAHWRILYLDGIHFTVRHGEQTDSTILLTALGVDLEGNKIELWEPNDLEYEKLGEKLGSKTTK